ncbi:nickel-dependent hydrogenase large subunit [candidate division KSB1 bacterium]|nr:nickel-dependent hydrogenase large subunit [candidate division KSB1 bacterium]
MATKVVVDPITRIEGHLRIQAQLDSANQIVEAQSTSAMFRGIELIARDRDPRTIWALVQRICGVCTTVHAIASLRAVEDALKIKIPKNADLIRKIIITAQNAQDHLVHFYHLHAVDWVDVVSALKGDPKEAADIAKNVIKTKYPKSTEGYFLDVKKKLATFAESGQLGIFANAYWGHPAYKLPPSVNLIAVAHYLEALNFQKEIVKIHAIFGGKNPHLNFIVGGMPCAINLDAVDAINMERLNRVAQIIDDTIYFINEVYVKDLVAVASFYKNWLYGGGHSKNAVLAYGEFATEPGDYSTNMIPGGVVLNGDLSKVYDVDIENPEIFQEHTTHSWYENKQDALHPYDGETSFKYAGPEAPWEWLDENAKYSWLKSPRWKGLPCEVGPLARYIVAYARGYQPVVDQVNWLLSTLKVPVTALFSTLGRTGARCLEAQHWADLLKQYYNELIANIKSGDTKTANTEKWDPATWPSEAHGVGLHEAPRGALAHFIKIKDGKVANYQCVVPSTWNAGPRDAKNQRGPYEESLVGTPMADPHQPLEIIRTIHSFDPCIACGTHVIDLKGNTLADVKIL